MENTVKKWFLWQQLAEMLLGISGDFRKSLRGNSILPTWLDVNGDRITYYKTVKSTYKKMFGLWKLELPDKIEYADTTKVWIAPENQIYVESFCRNFDLQRVEYVYSPVTSRATYDNYIADLLFVTPEQWNNTDQIAYIRKAMKYSSQKVTNLDHDYYFGFRVTAERIADIQRQINAEMIKPLYLESSSFYERIKDSEIIKTIVDAMMAVKNESYPHYFEIDIESIKMNGRVAGYLETVNFNYSQFGYKPLKSLTECLGLGFAIVKKLNPDINPLEESHQWIFIGKHDSMIYFKINELPPKYTTPPTLKDW